MKKSKILINLICILLSSYSVCSQTCPPVIETYPFCPFMNNIDSPEVASPEPGPLCHAYTDVTLYLARMVDMKKLWKLLEEGDYSTYCNQIQALVELKATFVTRINEVWGKGIVYYFSGSNYWNYHERIISDINNAFDNEGLRRPIIQAGLWETMDPLVCNVGIPDCVVEYFSLNNPDWNTTGNYYSVPRNFLYKNICFDSEVEEIQVNCSGLCNEGSWPQYENLIIDPNQEETCKSCNPDITKIETQMWYFYIAKNFIDRGYTAIWLGDQKVFAKNDAGFEKTTWLVNAIRDYAESKGQIVIINGEGGTIMEHGQSNTFLTDMAAISLWPREILINPNTGQAVNVGIRNDQNVNNSICNDQTGSYNANMFQGTACDVFDETRLSFADKCHGGYASRVEENGGGVSPDGCNWTTPPTFYYFDSNVGCTTPTVNPEKVRPAVTGDYYLFIDNNGENCDNPQTPSINCNEVHDGAFYLCWGYDDLTYFMGGGLETDACRADWLKLNMERVKTFSEDNNVFIIIPGMYLIDQAIGTTCGVDRFILSQHEDLLENISAFMAPIPIEETDIEYDTYCSFSLNDSNCDVSSEICDGVIPPMKTSYRFRVKRPDTSSRYSWHFKKNDGTWLPKHYGLEATLSVDAPMEITIYLVQENLALDDLDGNRMKSIHMILEPSCCINEFQFQEISFDVNVSILENCTAQIQIMGESKNIDHFFWNFIPEGIGFSPLNQNGSIGIISSQESTGYIYYTVCGIDFETQTIYTYSGSNPVIFTNCTNTPYFTIIPNLINKVSANEITLKISSELATEIINDGVSKQVFIARSLDGQIVQTINIQNQNTIVNISSMNAGMYAVIMEHEGQVHSSNFMIIESY